MRHSNNPRQELQALKARVAALEDECHHLRSILDCNRTMRVNDHDGATDQFGQAPLSGICSYIKVSDTGAGIDEDTQAKMWDPFFSTSTTGRGLGLAVVQGVVRSHGGRIRVVSRLGAGTKIQIVLPAAQIA